MKTSEAQKRATARYRERLKQNGLCIWGCGRRIAPDLRSLCAVCAEKQRRKYAYRKNRCLCVRCGHPAAGGTLCSQCQKYYKKRRERKNPVTRPEE